MPSKIRNRLCEAASENYPGGDGASVEDLRKKSAGASVSEPMSCRAGVGDAASGALRIAERDRHRKIRQLRGYLIKAMWPGKAGICMWRGSEAKGSQGVR